MRQQARTRASRMHSVVLPIYCTLEVPSVIVYSMFLITLLVMLVAKQ